MADDLGTGELRSALLCGRDHHRYGRVAAVAEGRAAIAISIGGAPKVYTHVDPNEDVALFVHGPGGILAAVADGHDGAAGSLAACEHLRSVWGATWTASTVALATRESWEESAREAFAGANQALLETATRAGWPPAPTTLSFVLARPADDLLLYASMGDSHIFLVEGDTARDVSWMRERDGRPCFLGFDVESPDTLRAKTRIVVGRLEGLRAAILATDGLSERGIGVEDPAAAALDASNAADDGAADVRALETSRTLAETALDAHRQHRSGDNIATATIWLE